MITGPSLRERYNARNIRGDLFGGLTAAVVVLAGLIQIGFGLLGIGRFIKLAPQPVISGFMSGIGFIIIIVQLAPMLGQATDTS